MIFLIEYDRRAAKTVSIRSFAGMDRENAADVRLQREIQLQREGVDREVVLLDAENEAALRRTHARYFEDIGQMISRFESSAGAFVVRERKDD